MMVLQCVTHRKPYIGLCSANNRRRGGEMTLAPWLDLKTSLGDDFQVSPKPHATAIFGLSEGPWHGRYGPSGHYVGPHGCPYCHQMVNQALPRGNGRFDEKPNFNKLSRATKQPIQCENGQVLTSKGPYGGGGGGSGVPRVGTREPRHRLEGPDTRKKFIGTQVQLRTQRPQYTKKF